MTLNMYEIDRRSEEANRLFDERVNRLEDELGRPLTNNELKYVKNQVWEETGYDAYEEVEACED